MENGGFILHYGFRGLSPSWWRKSSREAQVMVVKVCGWKAAVYIIADQDVEKGWQEP